MYLELKRNIDLIQLKFTFMIEVHLPFEENEQVQQIRNKIYFMYHKEIITRPKKGFRGRNFEMILL